MHSKEFILQFEDSADLRLTLEDREDLVNLIKMRYANLQPKKQLKIFGIPKNMANINPLFLITTPPNATENIMKKNVFILSPFSAQIMI